MYLSKREKLLLTLLMNQPSGVTVSFLIEKLDVSRRTVYRELSNAEETLDNFGLKLVKDAKGYIISGDKENLDKLRNSISEKKLLDDFSKKQRQRILIIKLLLAEDELKIDGLAIDLGVSASTIQSDLQSIEQMFQEYKIEVERRKSFGIIAHADEISLRLIISGLISIEFNEFNFFRLFDEANNIIEERYHSLSNVFLEVIDQKALEISFKSIRQYEKFRFDEVTDTQLQNLIILLALTAMRIKDGHTIKYQDNKIKQKREKNKVLAEYLLDELTLQYSNFIVTEEEINFLTSQIEGLNVPLKHEFSESYDINLIYKTRELIRSVSDEMNRDLREDKALYNDLLAHINASLSRDQSPIYKKSNPLLDKIYYEFTELSHVVEKHLKRLFLDIDFHANDVLYIVIHFASAFERTAEINDLSILIVCSSGVGTAKILESRLVKNIPEINAVDISTVSNLYKHNFEEYDLILSTIFLNGFEQEYKVVTPLIMDDEMENIKTIIAQKVSHKQSHRKVVSRNTNTIQSLDQFDEFNNFYRRTSIINAILHSFNVKTIKNKPSIRDMLEYICSNLEEEVILEQEPVVQKLERRLNQAPIGIPDTQMALFHCIDSGIKQPFFSIYDLEEPINIQDMSHSNMKLTRVLLMLGPEPIDEMAQEILGTISGSIVENQFNLQLFNEGSREVLEQFISQLFLSILKN
ncbi:BglG family transcription antiterminator [Dolosigranulum pigrum]|jgi:transcription regulator, mannitol operon|uniref:BglG family transcription antiterminator n=1 Tax=Dolosigranulum pigrum TaxID=29394 RepID=UPI001AD892A7|nr:BglG family transcription antiterminator [Dolosigranulum pigrum]QTJ34365.1 transcription antiterminator [Dolosigranulum pigrum]QTJ39542.1 transcription antiterminator [Dolosigranulum pigrum]QTJ48032.1 transcription antiterminator [Dolosigranulum pigrum]